VKKLVFVLLITVVAIAAFLANNTANKPNKEITTAESQSLDSEIKLPEITASKEVASLINESEVTDEFNPYESEVFKGQVNLVADQYAETARFPIGSQPIKNIADARQPEPFEETEVETPSETESGETIQISAAVDKFQYFTNDIINVRLKLSRVPVGDFVKAEAVISGSNGDTPLKAELQATDSSQLLLIGSFDTSLVPANVFSEEMIVKLSVSVGDEPFFTTVSFNYTAASAKLVGLGLVKPNGANLEIPLEYSVFIDGYYFVNAILSDQQTGQPLITIQTEGRMPQGIIF